MRYLALTISFATMLVSAIAVLSSTVCFAQSATRPPSLGDIPSAKDPPKPTRTYRELITSYVQRLDNKKIENFMAVYKQHTGKDLTGTDMEDLKVSARSAGVSVEINLMAKTEPMSHSDRNCRTANNNIACIERWRWQGSPEITISRDLITDMAGKKEALRDCWSEKGISACTIFFYDGGNGVFLFTIRGENYRSDLYARATE